MRCVYLWLSFQYSWIASLGLVNFSAGLRYLVESGKVTVLQYRHETNSRYRAALAKDDPRFITKARVQPDVGEFLTRRA